MNELLIIDAKSQTVLMDSRVTARELGVEHQNLRELMENHPDELGVILFETGKPPKGSKGGRPERWALLTERQVMAILTLVRNTEESVPKKMMLVDLFFAMREALQDKRITKAVRKDFTDVIQQAKELGQLEMHGHEYSNMTNLVYRQALGVDAKHFRESHGLDNKANCKDHMTPDELKAVNRLERLVMGLVESGYEYQQIKEIVEKRALPGKKAA